MKKEKQYLRVKDLIQELQKYDGNLPVIVTHEGKDHNYGVKLSEIKITTHPYFGNDWDALKGFGMKSFEDYDEDIDGPNEENLEFLNIATI